MRVSERIVTLAAAMVLCGLMLAPEVQAHGGSFRGPNGGVPPGLREPSDPEPPPPPPSDPGTPGGPITPTDPGPGPITPPETGHDTGGDNGPPPPPTGPTQGPKPKASTKSLTFESWRFWWAYNSDDILNLKSHIYSSKTASASAIFFSSKSDEENRRNAQRPTERAITTTIIPALMRSLERKDDHEDIHGGAIIALGKVGTATNTQIFRDATFNEYKNSKGQKMDFGLQATESAALALGLIPSLSDKEKEGVRNALLEIVQSDKLRPRERAWAAVGLGLQRDRDAVRPLWALLEKKYSDDNVPAGILCGLGLIGDPSIVEDLNTAFDSGKLNGVEVSDRVRAFIGYAITKIADPKSLDVIGKILKGRGVGRAAKRSAAIAAGTCGAKSGDAKVKDEVVKTLERFLDNSGGDPSGENFAIIALSQIATDKAMRTLIKLTADGKYGQREFAGIGLATQVFYADRAKELKTGEGMDAKLREDIVKALRDASDKNKAADTKAAFILGLGLVKDRASLEQITMLAAKQGTDPVLRGFCCVSLGLLGDTSEQVKAALKFALEERSSQDLRRDAATGLGLLKDAESVKLLLDMLKTAKSFAVQGQLIQAIGTIGDHTAIDPLVELLDNTSQQSQTRAMAAVGLGMIGDLREIPALGRLSKDFNYRASVPDLDELLFIL